MRIPLLALLLLLVPTGCSTTPERWAVLHLERLSYPNLYQQVADLLDGQGYRVVKQDVEAGRIETDWNYGFAVHELRAPSRRKVVARVSQLEGERLEVRVRVREQVIRKGGILATHIRDSDAWEDYDDDYDEAEFLVAKLGALLQDYRVRVNAVDGEEP